MYRFAIAFTLAAITGLPAQTYNSGSTGSDGALNIAANLGAIDFLPATFNPPLDPDGDNIFHFTTITVGAGTTLRFRTPFLGGEGKPIYWLAQGDVLIQGTLDLNADPGNTGGLSARGGAGGYNGGRGGQGNLPPQSGNGPGGSAASALDAKGAGHATAPTAVGSGRTYGNEYVQPLLGGSGGGGSAFAPGYGGGGGGGAILIASSSRVTMNGTIHARGGTGRVTASVPQSASGGGSGGAVRLIAPDIGGTGVVDVTGGNGANANSIGGVGRIRIEAFRYAPLTSILPNFSQGSPGPVFLPNTAPALSATTVDGVAVAALPTGSFAVPDAVINNGSPVTITLTGRNIPLGTIVEVVLQAENQSQVVVQSTPLAGTLGSSTATATATFASGFTRFFLRANW